jgi:TPP-dependent pyruvate/acetoin dehydrogenase alpha subunit|tara:strand:+ start:3646 stop:4476 length:831 start_codon:yes stop_codon:yes gene_type:complete
LKNFRLEIFKKASLCRNFENELYKKVQDKLIKFPVYLSAGQEFIAATVAQKMSEINIEPDIFIQHRGHSTYLAFGGDIDELIDEMLGRKTGCSGGMGGSASIQCKEKNIFGHDGLMGNQMPIGVGACFASKLPTIIFVGDSAAEEDYSLSSIGWASTKKLPILFIVEDNNLSILTEKKIRRNWEMHDVANGMRVESYDISDNPVEINKHLKNVFNKPLLLNINTIRKYWHAGAGTDGENFDRYEEEMLFFRSEGKEIDEYNKNLVTRAWKKQLEKP